MNLLARNTICFGLVGLMSGLMIACGKDNRALRSRVQDGADQSATSRDDFFNDGSNTDTIKPEDIAKDTKVKDLSEIIKTRPLEGCGETQLVEADQAIIPTLNFINPSSKAITGNVTIMGKGTLTLGGKASDFKVSNLFSVVSASPNNATNRATRFAQKISTNNSSTNLSQAEIQTVLQAKPTLPLCGFVMASATSSLSNDQSTFMKASFDKPVVQFINPKLSIDRIRLQLVNPIKISKITATIETNDQEIEDSGLIKQGDIEVTLIPTKKTLVDSVGQTVTIESQVAYRITNKFQDAGDNNGTPSILDQVAEYYITNNKVTHMVVKTPRQELPIIVYYSM